MGQARSQRFIRSVIRQIWNQAGNGANTFLEALNTCQSGHWEKVATGFTVQSSSGAGYTTNFHIAASSDDINGNTPEAMQELCEHILENYQIVIDAGIAEDGAAEGSNVDASQSVFVRALWLKFPTIKGVQNNWAYLQT